MLSQMQRLIPLLTFQMLAWHQKDLPIARLTYAHLPDVDLPIANIPDVDFSCADVDSEAHLNIQPSIGSRSKSSPEIPSRLNIQEDSRSGI